MSVSKIWHLAAGFLLTSGFLLLLAFDHLVRISFEPGLFHEFLRSVLSAADTADDRPTAAISVLVFLAVPLFLRIWSKVRFGPVGAGGRTFPGPFLRACWPELVLFAAALWSATTYTRGEDAGGSRSSFAIFYGAMAFGQWAAVLLNLNLPSITPCSVRQPMTTALLLAITCTALYHPDMGVKFYYHGFTRWTGPFFNPNTFGVIMGGGVMLAAGEVLLNLKVAPSTGLACNVARILAPGVMMLVCALALVASCSRGAWAGCLCGGIYLACAFTNSPLPHHGAIETGQSGIQRHYASSRLFMPLSITGICMLIISLLSLRDAPNVLMERISSVANINDFSWRNRVSALPGALQMIGDYPFAGAGWDHVEVLYGQFYRPNAISEGTIQPISDYLALALILGLPSLIAILAYVWHEFAGRHKSLAGNSPEKVNMAFRTVASQAAFLVPAVGFLTEGGLFHIGSATVFWTLLALGSARNPTRI